VPAAHVGAAGAVVAGAAGDLMRGARVAIAAGAAAALAALVAVLVLPAGAARTAPAAHPRPFDGRLAGAPLQRANCESWHAAPPTQRSQAVKALSATIGGASTSGGVGTTMPDRDVAALLDRVCGTPGTNHFALYLIYARAAAFSRHRGPTPITAPSAQPGL
jgi:hypothetical protein